MFNGTLKKAGLQLPMDAESPYIGKLVFEFPITNIPADLDVHDIRKVKKFLAQRFLEEISLPEVPEETVIGS